VKGKMYIKEIKTISNYRNLSGQSMVFDKDLNYIIGENNIGKTNILELLNIILSEGKFKEADFADLSSPIEVKYTISYDDSSIGFFEDNFDINEDNCITIIAEQDLIDGRISYYHDTPNKTSISFSIIKKINSLYYFAQRLPSKELDFKGSNGSSKTLNYLIKKSLEIVKLEESDLINSPKINDVIGEVNKSINYINDITGDSVNASLDSSHEKLLARLLILGDQNGRELTSLGEGIQYAFNIILQIIDAIYRSMLGKTPEEFRERLICSSEKYYFPLILLLDEPEIHQHPYRQRSLMKKINDLLNNKNESFIKLIKGLFNIDGLKGQIFIATHSPNILLNDYKQFLRIYKDNATQTIKVASGNSFDLDVKLYKHLLHNFLYLKEATFSKKIIFVEGDTENGAIPIFAEKKKFDLDENGVGVIKLDGADSVKYCMELYKLFGIETYAIIDADKKERYHNNANIFFTTEKDYEEDVFASFELKDYLTCCKELDILQSMIGIIKKYKRDLDVSKFKEDPSIIELDETTAKSIVGECKEAQLKKLKDSKNACKGAILAKYVTKIPSAFDELIEKVKGEVV
jgi:hypothetical protein